MEQMQLSPEVINAHFPDADFIVNNKEVVVGFFRDNMSFYNELMSVNNTTSYDIGANKNGITVTPSKRFLWLHEEKDLEVDQKNPPLNPLLINEGKAELIAKFFKKNVDAENAFLLYSKSYKKNYKSPDQTLASHL